MGDHKWLSIDDTHILMQLRNAGERQEWHPVAQVTLRQIYPSVPPMYYVWACEGSMEIGKGETLEEVRRMAEASTG